MSETEALRSSILQQTDALGSKRRFGLFSSPISHAIGDDGAYKTIAHPRDQTGKPQTKPKGIYTNPTSSGQLKKSYFGAINSLASGQVKDVYMDETTRLLKQQNEDFKKGFKNDVMFKPSSGHKQEFKPLYEYKQQNNPEKDPQRNRQQDGRVKIEARNVFTNQQSTVLRSYFKPIKYIEDPYERADQTMSEYAKKQKSLQRGELDFKLNSHPTATFSTQKKVYGCDVDFPQKKIKEPAFNIYKHENRWKTNNANKSGIYGYLAPFPAFMENPPKQKIRLSPEANPKQQFRRMSIALSKPSPSIAYNKNLIRTISHSTSHRN